MKSLCSALFPHRHHPPHGVRIIGWNVSPALAHGPLSQVVGILIVLIADLDDAIQLHLADAAAHSIVARAECVHAISKLLVVCDPRILHP